VRLELGREPPLVPPLRHPALLGCSGLLANPPLPRGRFRSLATAGAASRSTSPLLWAPPERLYDSLKVRRR
jgi:hypothetical protein